MPAHLKYLSRLDRLFRRKRAALLEDLRAALGTVSRTTIFRILRAAGYFTSYSHAGRYYRLGRIPKFDGCGLWSWRGIGCSSRGTLRATLVFLIAESPAGQTHQELRQRLGLRVHDTLRSLVLGGAIGRGMTQWILDYPAEGNGQGFPFDLPWLGLYHRCRQAARALDAFLEDPPDDPQVRQCLGRLRRILRPVACDTPAFGPMAGLRDVRSAVDRLSRSLRQRRSGRRSGKDRRAAIDIILTHLESHGDFLWGHAIRLAENSGGGLRVVERTSNVLESRFRALKHGERRRSGRKILWQNFEHLPAPAALAANLNRADYVSLVCGSLDGLPEAFAKLDARSRQNSPSPTVLSSSRTGGAETASLSTVDRQRVRTKEMTSRIIAAAKSRLRKKEVA